MAVQLHQGDMRAVLADYDAATFTACVTDPPYHLGDPRSAWRASPSVQQRAKVAQRGFMGQAWDGGDVAFQSATWQAVWRVLKPGAYCLAFGGSRTFHRLACALEDAGFVLVDTICWLRAGGFPKSHDISKALDREAGAEREVVGPYERPDGRPRHYEQWEPKTSAAYGEYGTARRREAPATPRAQQWAGYGTALAPAWEPVLVALKPYDKTYAYNARQHGVAGFYIDGARIATNGEDTRRVSGVNQGVYGADNRQGMRRGGGARWPKNVLLDAGAACRLDAAVGERTVGGGSGTGTAVGISFVGRWTKRSGIGYGDSGPVSRFFYTSKASPSERGEGNTWPTVKPLDLMRYLLGLVTYPEQNRILDPFCGSGSTLVAADRLGLDAVGIDLDAEALVITRRRLRADAPLFVQVEG